MKYLEKQIRKNPSKNDYVIGIGSKDILKADEDKYFYHNKKEKFVSDVIIYYKEDHVELMKEIQDLKDCINDKDETIKKLQNELTSIHSDNKKEIKSIQDENNERIDKLNKDLSSKDLQIQEIKSKYDNEIANLKLQQTKDIAELKNTHSNEVFEAHDKFKNTLISLRMKDHKENTRFIAEFEDLNFIDKHTSKFNNIIKEMKENDEIKLLNIDEDFPKLQLNK